jgi:hypothetical protein
MDNEQSSAERTTLHGLLQASHDHSRSRFYLHRMLSVNALQQSDLPMSLSRESWEILWNKYFHSKKYHKLVAQSVAESTTPLSHPGSSSLNTA